MNGAIHIHPADFSSSRFRPWKFPALQNRATDQERDGYVAKLFMPDLLHMVFTRETRDLFDLI
ncbi:hypothetical protein D3871_09650 [Noviherbaspirillum saxi]|uniref:Uncharacterized protein n=1 Tax=Noviherbaspirillum saxi TaxID=2320863 RepID=A0A3A3FVY7_9BURK|nr:hypothetical protein D3871_09650 [Noviherbaspirillum saxi]